MQRFNIPLQQVLLMPIFLLDVHPAGIDAAENRKCIPIAKAQLALNLLQTIDFFLNSFNVLRYAAVQELSAKMLTQHIKRSGKFRIGPVMIAAVHQQSLRGGGAIIELIFQCLEPFDDFVVRLLMKVSGAVSVLVQVNHQALRPIRGLPPVF